MWLSDCASEINWGKRVAVTDHFRRGRLGPLNFTFPNVKDSRQQSGRQSHEITISCKSLISCEADNPNDECKSALLPLSVVYGLNFLSYHILEDL
jgi:hypothetical protein